MQEDIYRKLKENVFPAISDFDPSIDEVCWFIPRKIYEKVSKNGKTYWIIDTLDDNNVMTKIRCWGIKAADRVSLNRPYLAKLSYNEKWGFSTWSIANNFRLLC